MARGQILESSPFLLSICYHMWLSHLVPATISNLKFSRENPYQPMKSYTNGLQKTPEEENAEFQDFINSLIGPFWVKNFDCEFWKHTKIACFFNWKVFYEGFYSIQTRFGTLSANWPMKLPAGAYRATV